MPSTSRAALPYPAGTAAPNIPVDMQAIADRLAAVGAMYLQGTLAARPAAATANQGYIYWTTDGGHLYYSTGSAWQKIDFRPDIGTSFPTSPATGDETIIKFATSRQLAYWQFLYDSTISDAYKWAFIGGAPMWDHGSAGGSLSGDGLPHQPIPGGGFVPSIALSYAGNYRIRFSLRASVSSGSPTYLRAILLRNGVGTSAYSQVLANSGATVIEAGSVADVQESSTSVTWSVAAQSDASSTWTISDWRVEAVPVRVSP